MHILTHRHRVVHVHMYAKHVHTCACSAMYIEACACTQMGSICVFMCVHAHTYIPGHDCIHVPAHTLTNVYIAM